MFLLKVVIIASLVKLLLTTNKAVLCAGLYTGIGFVLGLAFGHGIIAVAIASAIAFGLSFVYFWLLDKFEDSILFWIILIVGLPIAFF